MSKHIDPSSPNIVAYDSYEEMMADQQQAHDAAVSNITESQRSIPLGGYACNIVHLADLGPIFGAVQSAEEVRAWHELYAGIGDADAARAVLAERGEFDLPMAPGDPARKVWEDDGFATAEEFIDYYVQQHLNSYADGYLFGTWMSNLEPDGELGSAHASVCVPIDRETYLDAKANGGYVSEASAHKISAAMIVVRDELKAREGTTEGEGDDHNTDNSDR